jgi:hypothetical protein
MPRFRARRGITMIELIIAMTVGLIVLGTVVAYVGTTDRNMSASTAREDYARKARYLGLAFRRDIGEAGTGIESATTWGTVSVSGDTISLLRVYYDPEAEIGYPVMLVDPAATYTSETLCGTACITVPDSIADALEPGDVARIQVGPSVRRLGIVASLDPGAIPAGSRQLRFFPVDSVLHRASVSASLPVPGITSASYVQRLEMVAYWRDADNILWRATNFDPATGALEGELLVTGCTAFEVLLVFADGTTGTQVNANVAGRRYTDINAINIVATLESDLTDERVNDGVPLRRTYTWQVQPRNLIYERYR